MEKFSFTFNFALLDLQESVKSFSLQNKGKTVFLAFSLSLLHTPLTMALPPYHFCYIESNDRKLMLESCFPV